MTTVAHAIEWPSEKHLQAFSSSSPKLLKALYGSNDSTPPVWLMRQAGRYMASYRALRERYPFLALCKRPELAAAVTMMPIEQLDVDAAILFSDILLLLEPLAVGLSFDEGRGPLLASPLERPEAIDRFPQKLPLEEFAFVTEAIQMTKAALDRPLIGFAGAPFTLASYLIEGKTARHLPMTKRWVIQQPAAFRLLLDQLTDYVIDYLSMQAEAGADLLQLFDSWTEQLSPAHFSTFCEPCLKRICSAMKAKGIPLILFCRATASHLDALIRIGPSAISSDWMGDLATLRQRIPSSIALQGNMEPAWLYADRSVIEQQAAQMAHSMRSQPNYIANLGHGIPPDVEIDAVRAFVDGVRS